jgi:hypothetical protein
LGYEGAFRNVGGSATEEGSPFLATNCANENLLGGKNEEGYQRSAQPHNLFQAIEGITSAGVGNEMVSMRKGSPFVNSRKPVWTNFALNNSMWQANPYES